MPRIPRQKITTPYIHVMVQGIEKNYIFSKAGDIRFFIRNMYKLTEEYPLKIIAFCIMNNHAHILVRTKEIDNLIKYMHRLNTKYAKYYNKKNNRVGFVFRNRYESEAIYTKEHLYNCIEYIFNNPVRAGLCKDPSEYQYSNYKRFHENKKD